MDIDVSKENIQPLRGGRNLVQLGAALQAQSDVDAQRQLLLQKEEHEAAIVNYKGTDPIDPWFNYIQWTEQSFPKHGHEGHIDKLLKDCLQLFEKEQKYYQDRRFVKLWIKYVDNLTNPTEVYQRLYNTGIGVECSEFYRAWACYCEELGDFKKANQVYMLGLQAKAQPLDELEQAHTNFQLFFAQRLLHDDSPTKRKAATALAETRQALTSLRSFKRRNIATAPIQRVGENVRSHLPGVVKQQAYDKRLPNSNIMVVTYEDGPSTSRGPAVPVAGVGGAGGAGAGAAAGPASLVQACSNVENEKEVGVWTNAKIKMVHSNVVPHHPLPFTPYEDEDDALRLGPKHMAHCVDDLTFTVALCVPDPPDATKIASYNKSQVYVSETEFSLEEIKSRKYNLKPKIKTEKLEEEEMQESKHQANINETLAQCSALETLANCALDAEQDHMGALMPPTMPTLQNVTRVTNMHSPGEPKVLVNLDSKEVSEHAGNKKYETNQRCSPSTADRENQINPSSDSNYDDDSGTADGSRKQVLMKDFDKSLLNNLLCDSVTVHTKEARWELRNIFTDNEPSMVQPVVQYEVPKFDIHEDRSMTMALNAKKKQEIVDDHSLPMDKENNAAQYLATPPSVQQPALQQPPVQQNVDKTAYYDEPSCTQVFNFNVNVASTPNMFKKPTSCVDQASKMPSVPKFCINESTVEGMDTSKKEEASRHSVDPHSTIDHHPGGLSVIMEATREYNSKSSSSSSGQSIRTNFTGYTTTPFSEKTQQSNFDSVYGHQNDPVQQASASKRISMPTQARMPNGQFAKTFPVKRDPTENKATPPSPSAPYLSHDHQYQKPSPQNFNGFSPQRPMQAGFQQNYNYPQGYANSQMMNQQQPQNYANPNAYQSPQQQHPGVQHAQASSAVPVGYRSPSYNGQMGYHSPSPGHAVMSPPPGYAARQEYNYPAQGESQHPYPSPAQHPQPAPFQSPPHQPQYPNSQYYQRPSQAALANQFNQQNYPNVQTQYANAHMYANSSQHVNQSYSTYNQQAKPVLENNPSLGPTFQIYQSPQPASNSFRGPTQSGNVTQHNASQEMQARQENVAKPSQKQHDPALVDPNTVTVTPPKSQTLNRSPSTTLRNVRHDQSTAKLGQKSPDAGFSNQFLNFISNRNEPKDNANTPKFTNSPSISHKMHKNLYVSSPEQAQIPPSSGMSDSDSKDGLTAQTGTPIQSAKQTHEKNKDVSKRVLDFEHRVEVQSEDSRDSVTKDSRIPSVYSRQSDFQSDGCGMDVDSENSMECGSFKSMHSISLVETSDIPRPADIDFPNVIDPFNKKLLKSLLEYVKFPNKTHAEGYNEVRSVPKLQSATVISVGNNKFSVDKQLGKGNYGAVFLCVDLHTHKSVAVKYQKPSRPWEFYICQEIKARIKDPFMLPGYMDITTAFLGDNASMFVSEYSRYGSLLDVANKVRIATSKCINEFIVMLLTSEMLSIVHYLHKSQIIHADIKPDNFLLMKIPTQEWRTPSLQLIDMGCAIDMSLFPDQTTFRELIATEGFTCTEMREGRSWTYQTDLYCLAGTIHVILMGSYMKVVSRLGQWNIDKKLPRYMKVNLWDKIFTTLLNVPDCNNLPDLMDLKNDVDDLLSSVDNLGSQLRNFANVLKSR